MNENTRNKFEERLALIENLNDREAVRFFGGKYLSYLDEKIAIIETKRRSNLFCRIKDLLKELK